jgi:glutamyl-tRNA reductase
VSVLVVGLSHKSAPVAILEQAAVSGDTLTKLLRDIALAG